MVCQQYNKRYCLFLSVYRAIAFLRRCTMKRIRCLQRLANYTGSLSFFSSFFDLFTQDEKYKRACCSAYAKQHNFVFLCRETNITTTGNCEKRKIEKRESKEAANSKPSEKQTHECIPCTLLPYKNLIFHSFLLSSFLLLILSPWVCTVTGSICVMLCA